ncbi:hypothetical protein MOC02_07455 [Bacillus inaquosorum]|uniref:hypothetical protein n=1 Tax=Bacillus inaquosorum TaxID=483913 RepID=UPI002282DCE8|nr:hypothetical protein [Bacillus inaquosorum]MCY8083137.1 hypothetical protein [Bacillus inaquosorum]
MTKHVFKNVKLLATYSECYQRFPKSEKEIQDSFKKLPFLQTCFFLSRMSALSNEKLEEEEEFIKSIYFSELLKYNPDIEDTSKIYFRKSLMDNQLFTQRGILQMYKYLFAHGDYLNRQTISEVDFFRKIVAIALRINDTLSSFNNEKEIIADVFTNGVFSSKDSFKDALARTHYVYTVISQDKEQYYSKDFLDISSDFNKKYGYSIKDYIAAWFCLILYFDKNNRIDWANNAEYYKSTKFYPALKKILSEEAQDIHMYKEFCENSITKTKVWDSSEFISKPFIFINENKDFIPVSVYLMKKEFFNRLFYKVRDVYPKKDTRFLSFFGKPYEKYAQNLLEESINHVLDYQYSKSFRYGPKRCNESPDIMLRFNDRLLVIEVKSFRLSYNTVFNSTVTTVEEDIEKLVIEPLFQATQRVKEMYEHEVEFVANVKEIDFIVIGNGSIPKINSHKEMIKQRIESHFGTLSAEVKSYNYFNINEFEYFCRLLERRKPFFRALERYSGDTELFENFFNFLKHNSYSLKRPKILDKLFNTAIEDIKKTYF